jgi:hypothetical protein
MIWIPIPASSFPRRVPARGCVPCDRLRPERGAGGALFDIVSSRRAPLRGVAPQCIQPAAGGGLAARVPNGGPSHAYCRRRRLSIHALAPCIFPVFNNAADLDCTLRVLLQRAYGALHSLRWVPDLVRSASPLCTRPGQESAADTRAAQRGTVSARTLAASALRSSVQIAEISGSTS